MRCVFYIANIIYLCTTKLLFNQLKLFYYGKEMGMPCMWLCV